MQRRVRSRHRKRKHEGDLQATGHARAQRPNAAAMRDTGCHESIIAPCDKHVDNSRYMPYWNLAACSSGVPGPARWQTAHEVKLMQKNALAVVGHIGPAPR